MTFAEYPAEHEILLDGTRFAIRGAVTKSKVSLYPGKIVAGDTGRDSRPWTSVITFNDFRGGIGTEVIEGELDTDRLWWSTLDTLYRGHLVLPPEVVDLPSMPGSGLIRFVEIFRYVVYAVRDRSVYRYIPGQGWSNALITVDSRPVRLQVLTVGDSDALILLCDGGLAYTSDGTTWLDTAGDRQAGSDFRLPNLAGNPGGMTHDGADFIIGDRAQRRLVGISNTGGTRAQKISATLPAAPIGVALSGGRYYVLTEDGYIRCVRNNQRQAGNDVNLAPYRVDNSVLTGAVMVGDRLPGQNNYYLAEVSGSRLISSSEVNRTLKIAFHNGAWYGLESTWTAFTLYRYADDLQSRELVGSSNSPPQGWTAGYGAGGSRIGGGASYLFSHNSKLYVGYTYRTRSSGSSGTDRIHEIIVGQNSVSVGSRFLNQGIRFANAASHGGSVYLSGTDGYLYRKGAGLTASRVGRLTGGWLYSDGSHLFIITHLGHRRLTSLPAGTGTNPIPYASVGSVIGSNDGDFRLVSSVDYRPAAAVLPLHGAIAASGSTLLVAVNDRMLGFTVNANGSLTRNPARDFGLAVGNANPEGASFIGSSKLGVLDGTTLSIEIYTVEGQHIPAENKVLPSPVTNPTAFAFFDDRIYVADGANNRVYSDPLSVTNEDQFAAMAEWNDQVWGLQRSGQLYKTTDFSDPADANWAPDAKIPTSRTPAVDLQLYSSTAFGGGDALIALTETGVWEHDVDGDVFQFSGVEFPRSSENLGRSAIFGNELFIPWGVGVLQMSGVPRVTRPVGPEGVQGMPVDGEVRAIRVLNGLNELVAVYKNVDASGVGTSHVLARRQSAWRSMWSPGTRRIFEDGVIGDAYGAYSLYVASDVGIHRIDLTSEFINPAARLPSRRYAPYGEAITGWYDANDAELRKLGLRVRCEVAGATPNQTVEIQYALDYEAESWNPLAFRPVGSGDDAEAVLITQDGLHEAVLGADDAGFEWTSIRFRIVERSNDRARSPSMRSLSFEFERVLDLRWGYQAVIDMNNPLGDLSVLELKAKLEELAGSRPLVALRYLDEDSEDILVRVERVQMSEQAGPDGRALALVYMIEP